MSHYTSNRRHSEELRHIHLSRQADLATSPFNCEGHRKVWARRRVGRGVRVSRQRVLRVLREHRLLSPYRLPHAPPKKHHARITMNAPNVMWGTDGTRVFTVNDGWASVFAVVDD